MSKFIPRRLVLSAAVVAVLGRAQTQTFPKEFEVATVKANAANDNRFMIRPLPGGGLTITGVPLKMLIMEAYDVRTFQVSGGHQRRHRVVRHHHSGRSRSRLV